MEISNSILDSIQIITKHQIEKTKFDKTIEAQIIDCLNEETGYYRCSYQDATIYAYSNNLDIIYKKGNYVYILIPENNMSKHKIILGLTGGSSYEYIDLPDSKSLLVSVQEDQKNLKFIYKKSLLNTQV